MSGKVTTKDHGASKMLAQARELAKGKRVRVGILDDAPKDVATTDEAGNRTTTVDSAITLIEIAIIHEFGLGDVPQRSFIRATIDERKADIERLLVSRARLVLAGKITADQALDQVGAKVAGWVVEKIDSNIAPALAESTVEEKGSSVALVDTGQLKASVSWLVLAGGA